MLLKDACPFIPPNIPENLQSRIRLQTLCPLTNEEWHFFELAFEALEKELQLEGKLEEAIRVVIYIVDKDEFTLKIACKYTVGIHTSVVVYPINRWRMNSYEQERWTDTILHELSHCFWQIHDEDLVQQKVNEICRHIT